MKSLEKKPAFLMCLIVLALIFIFLEPLILLDSLSAQGAGQGGQTLGLGGLGTGAMIGLSGLNMMVSGFGMAGLGSPLLTGPFGLGLPGVSSSNGMLGTGSGISVGGQMLGLVPSTPYIMSQLPISPGFGFGPYFGQIMPIMGFGFMNPGILPIMPFSDFYDGGLTTGYAANFITPYANQLSRYQASLTGITGVPYFYYNNTIMSPPFPDWVYQLQSYLRPSIFPSSVIGHVYYMVDDQKYPLEGVKVTLISSSSQRSYTTNSDGFYKFSLLSGRYTFEFRKDGYKEQIIEIIVIGGMVEIVDDIIMELDPVILNRAPEFKDMLTKEVLSGEIIKLDPNMYVSDPDGDQLEITYSGWKANYWNDNIPYPTTDDDIGEYEVTIQAWDDEYLMEGTLTIIVYPGYEMNLAIGFNLISYPFEDGDADFTASSLVEELGGDPNKIYSIGYYDKNIDDYIWYYSDDNQNGTDFSIEIGKGYVIYANEGINEIVSNKYTGEKQNIVLNEGVNLIGIASYPEGYTSYELLLDLGFDYVESIYRFNPFGAGWESTYWLNGSPTGVNFPIFIGEAYKIQMKTDKNLSLPRLRTFSF